MGFFFYIVFMIFSLICADISHCKVVMKDYDYNVTCILVYQGLILI